MSRTPPSPEAVTAARTPLSRFGDSLWLAAAPLPHRLRLGRQRGGGLRLQSAQVNWLPGVLAIAIGAVVEPGQRLLDLAQQGLRTLPIDPVKLPIFGSTRLVGLIAHTGALIRIGGRRSGQFVLGVPAQAQQFAAEVFHLQSVHERLLG